MHMTSTDKKGKAPKRGAKKARDPMRPEVRKAFEEGYERHREVSRRLAKL